MPPRRRVLERGDFVNSCSEVWSIPQRVATGDDVDGFGNDVKRCHILVDETNNRMCIPATGDVQHRLSDVHSGDAATGICRQAEK